jgi:hypothetical protein
MTMMTPMGRGGRMYPRQRRWPRILAAFLALAVVAAAGVGAWWWFTQRDEPSGDAQAPSAEVCRTPTSQPPKSIPPPPQVQVDVANGTEQSGLAIDTADALTSRGFEVIGIGNTNRPVRQSVALVRYAQSGFASAIRLASYAPGAELVEVPKLKGRAVELWIGPDFAKVASRKDADVTKVTMPVGEPHCQSQGSK